MEKYRLVQEHKADPDEHEPAPEALSQVPSHAPEVRITQQGKPRNYISYAMNLFAEGSSTIVLKAMGRAINKAVTIAEILKRKMPLHQLNTLSSVEMIDVYEPVEEGLDVVTSRRYVSCMMITLSLILEHMDTAHSGYQPPLPDSEISSPSPGTITASSSPQTLHLQQRRQVVHHAPHPSQQQQQQQQRAQLHLQQQQQQQHLHHLHIAPHRHPVSTPMTRPPQQQQLHHPAQQPPQQPQQLHLHPRQQQHRPHRQHHHHHHHQPHHQQ